MRRILNESMQKNEKIIKKKLQDKVVVSEFLLEEEKLGKITRFIKRRVTPDNEKKLIDALWRHYPFTSLTITVFIAAYYYDHEGLWPHFRRKTGISDTYYWGQKLFTFLKENDYEVFEREKSKKYMNAILGHAGIPKYSVGNLIGNTIIPANERRLNEIDIYKNPPNFDLLHVGVKNFIRLGGTITFSMIHRIQSVWRNGKRPFTERYKGYLPNHILSGMDNYKPLYKNTIFEYSAPFLEYFVDGGTINLHIPSIRLNKFYIESMYWLITDETNGKTEKLTLTPINYKNEEFKEFTPEHHQFSIHPNNDYTADLYYIDDEGDIILSHSEKLSTKSPLIQFQNQNKIFSLTDVDLDKEYNSVTLFTTTEKAELIRTKAINSVVYEKQLKGNWKNYFAVSIFATGNERIQIDEWDIRLTDSIINPYLAGDIQDNIAHVNVPVFKQMPYIVLPDTVVEEISQGHITHIRVENLAIREPIPFEISTKNIIYAESEARIYLADFVENFDLHLVNKLSEFTVELYGRLGYDYQFSFLLMKDFNFELVDKEVRIAIPSDYNLNIQWPLNIDVRKIEEYSYIKPPNKQFKIKIAIFNSNTKERYDFILYTALYNIQFRDHLQNTYLLGSEISRDKWNTDEFVIDIDTTNPTFEKTFGKQCELAIKGTKTEIVNLPIFSNSINTYSRNHITERHLFDDVKLYYRFLKNAEWRLFLNVVNQWDLKFVHEDLKGKELWVKWTQSNYLNDKFIRIWKLHKPWEAYKDVPLKKRSTTFRYQFDETGVYMIEWRDKNREDFNKPVFDKGKYKIFYVDTDKSLAYHLLLADDDEYNNSKNNSSIKDVYTVQSIKRLLESIDRFGNKYLSLIIKDYDSCCDFTVRAGNVITTLYEEFSLEKHLIEILSQITGIQEMSPDVLFSVNKDYLNDDFQHTFHTKLRNKNILWGVDTYFTPKSLLSKSESVNLIQLNINIQETVPYAPILNDFYLHIEMMRFIFKVKQDEWYKKMIEDLLSQYAIDLNKTYLKFKSNSKMPREIFFTVDSRRTGDNDILSYKNYPNFIAQLACFNRSFLRNLIGFISEDEVTLIRKATQEILNIDKKWFMHDLIYIELVMDAVEK